MAASVSYVLQVCACRSSPLLGTYLVSKFTSGIAMGEMASFLLQTAQRGRKIG